MTLGEMVDEVKSLATQKSSNDLDKLCIGHINRAYRRLARARTWGPLLVRGEQFSTVADQMSYALPYPLDRIINDSLRYDVTTQLPGRVIPVNQAGGTERTVASAISPFGFMPIMASISQGAIMAFDSGTVVALANLDQAFFTASSPASTWIGRYVRFGVDSVNTDAGDYGYRVVGVNVGAKSITLDRPYRGPALTLATVSVTPANSKWLFFDPTFTDSAKVVKYDWYSKPGRLFNSNDIPEVPELCDAIIYQVLAENPIYHRPQSYDRLNYVAIARDHKFEAFKSAMQ